MSLVYSKGAFMNTITVSTTQTFDSIEDAKDIKHNVESLEKNLKDIFLDSNVSVSCPIESNPYHPELMQATPTITFRFDR